MTAQATIQRSRTLTDSRSPRAFVQALAEAPPGPMLDVGCGGGVLLELAEQVGRRMVGIDITQASVELCQARAAGSTLGHSFTQADVRDFDFGHQQWAAITAMTSLVALRRTEVLSVLDAIAKGLMPGGVAYFEVFTRKDPIYRGPKTLSADGFDYYYEDWQSPMYLFASGELPYRLKSTDALWYEELWVMDYAPYPHRHHEARLCCKKREEQ